jgi:hypothetical protein
MKNNELTKEQKLAVIDEILARYERDEDYHRYICGDVTDVAKKKGYVGGGAYALKLIPELLAVRPSNHMEVVSWFGAPRIHENRPRRVDALKRVREIVEGGVARDYNVLNGE